MRSASSSVRDSVDNVGVTDEQWDGYLRTYHRDHAGITERLLSRATSHEGRGTAYDWLRSAITSPDLVLDLGCGSAPMRDTFASAPYIGVDLSPDELRLALLSGRSSLVRANALALPLKDRSAPTVIAPMSLMLFTPTRAALEEVARVLRPGGTFAALLPNAWPLLPRDVLTAARLALALRTQPEFPQRLRSRPLAAALRRFGLTVTEDTSRLFLYPITSENDAITAVDGLYLPDLHPDRRAAAIRVLTSRAGRVDLPIPLRRVVATRHQSEG